MLDRLKEYISARIIRYLAQPTRRYAPFFAPDPEMTRRSLEPGDVVLIEGNTRLSAIIKFLTQSTWSHAALYVGERSGDKPGLDGFDYRSLVWEPANHSFGSAARTRACGSPSSRRTMLVPSTRATHL